VFSMFNLPFVNISFQGVMKVWIKNTLMYLKRSLYVYVLANIIFSSAKLVCLLFENCHFKSYTPLSPRKKLYSCVWGLNTTVNNYSTIRASVSAHPSDLQYTCLLYRRMLRRGKVYLFCLKLEHIEKVTLIT
jgi:hypothetical protein